MKQFRVRLITEVYVPFDEALLEGLINENHLMYLALERQQKENIQMQVVEIDYIGEHLEVIPVTARSPVRGVTLFEKEDNVRKIWTRNSTGSL